MFMYQLIKMELNEEQIEIILNWSFGCGYNNCGENLPQKELELRKMFEDELT